MSSDAISLTIPQARRLAVAGQLLPARRGTSILDVVKHVGYLQLDPTNSIARNHLLVLWSRLGTYDERELERLRWDSRELYEYSAAIVPVLDHPIHAASMSRFPNDFNGEWPEHVNRWIKDNAALRRSMISQFRRRGPLPSRELQDIAERSWRSTGWTNDRNVSRMLELMHAKGEVVVAQRSGQQRIWDLAGNWLPKDAEKLSTAEAERRVMERSARNLGVATALEIKHEFFAGGPWPGAERAIASLVQSGRLRRAEIEGLKGDRFVHVDSLAALEQKPSRQTSFLSPFDPLIRNRKRTEALWDFRYRIEIYVPKAKREFGYFVLPILHGDRLVGRIDPVFDRKADVLRVNNVWWEPGARPVSFEQPLRRLARFVGAERIEQ